MRNIINVTNIKKIYTDLIKMIPPGPKTRKLEVGVKINKRSIRLTAWKKFFFLNAFCNEPCLARAAGPMGRLVRRARATVTDNLP